MFYRGYRERERERAFVCREAEEDTQSNQGRRFGLFTVIFQIGICELYKARVITSVAAASVLLL